MAASVLGPAQALVRPPIIFVHGNAGSAALWLTTLWRFESNGFPGDRLHAIDFTCPQARDDDALPQPGRSGSADQLRALSAFVDRVRKTTGSMKAALVASSRGANTVRNYIRNGGGAAVVAHAVLAGGVNHGVYKSTTFNPGSEFNGDGPFIRALNAAYPEGNEVAPEVRWLTLRSDGFDMYAQPDGSFIGQPGMQTGLTFDGPALKGANNVVLPGTDHREVAFGPAAFAQMFEFITGARPATTGVVAADPVVLDGTVSGFVAGSPTNLPLAGATVTVHEVAPASGMRIRTARQRRVVGAEGRWGPLTTHAQGTLEFVIEADGYPTTHIYRPAFPRSSSVVHLRPAPPESLAADDVSAGSTIVITRPRGYFGVGRDTFLIDGNVPPDVTGGVPAVSTARMQMPAVPLRTVVTRFNDQTIAVRNWPASEGSVVYAEFHY